MTQIAIITGSTRPGRRGDVVAEWIRDVAEGHLAAAGDGATARIVDVADFGLPLLDEPVPAIFGDYRHPHTVRWAETISSFDGFVFVTPEYNHSIPAALKNAIDYLYAEWNDKPAGFVSYGVDGGIRAVEHLRSILAEVRVAGLRPQVALSLFTDFDLRDPTDPATSRVLVRSEERDSTLTTMLDELIIWSRALKQLREQSSEPAPAAA
jgi:NAD(P)H-dependent FMN reductase